MEQAINQRTSVSVRADMGVWLAELTRYRQLLISLTWRDVRVRYKQSVLGFAWALLVPVSMMLVFTLVLGGQISPSGPEAHTAPYPLYALSGLLPWMFFSSSLSGCVNSLVANRNLVTKVYFPREVFPLSCIGSALVDFLLSGSVLVGLLLWYRWNGQWSASTMAPLITLPLLLLIQIAFTAGLGMLLAMGNLFYRDVRQLTGVLLPLWMFVSAVVIPPPSSASWAGSMLSLNPLTPLIEGFRACIVGGVWPAAPGVVYSGVVAALAVVVGWVAFRRNSSRFAECI